MLLLTICTYGTKYPNSAEGTANAQMTYLFFFQISTLIDSRSFFQIDFPSSLEVCVCDGGGCIPGNGLNNSAHPMMRAISAAIHTMVGSRFTFSNRNARENGIIMVKTELPAVTKPLTTPKYLLK